MKKFLFVFMLFMGYSAFIVCNAQNIGDKYYNQGVAQQKVKTEKAQKSAISYFERAKKAYDSNTKKTQCDIQILQCNKTLKELNKQAKATKTESSTKSKTAKQYYASGIDKQKSKSVSSQNGAISDFEKAKSKYSKSSDRLECDKQIRICENNISLIQKQRDTDTKYEEGLEFASNTSILYCQKQAISIFKKAKKAYTTVKEKNKCDRQIAKCKDNINQIKESKKQAKEAKPKSSTKSKTAKQYYASGVDKQKSKTISSQNSAISDFEKAKSKYSESTDRKECDNQIRICEKNIALIQKKRDAETRYAEGMEFAANTYSLYSQKQAISLFKKAQKEYTSLEDKNKCNKQISKCQDNISKLKKADD